MTRARVPGSLTARGATGVGSLPPWQGIGRIRGLEPGRDALTCWWSKEVGPRSEAGPVPGVGPVPEAGPVPEVGPRSGAGMRMIQLALSGRLSWSRAHP